MVSCGENRIDKTLDYVENIVVSYPDSALMLLDSIKNPYKLTNLQRVRHTILTLYAKDLTEADISKDTMIVYTRNFLKTTDNPMYLAFAEYYLGRMYQVQGRSEQALKLYLDAKANTEHSDDDNIKGLIYSCIGQQYYVQRKYENAIGNFKLALEHFNKSQENHKRKMAVLNIIGNCFLLKKEIDSAMICYNESLRLAKTAQDSANVIHNLGMAYLWIHELNNAKQQLFLALNLNSDSVMQSSIYLSISKIYENRNIDSAIYFAKLSESLSTIRNDIYALSANYKKLSQLEEKNGNYRKALYYNHKYIAHLIKIKNENVPDIQGIEIKHELYLLQNKPSYYGITILCLCLAGIFYIFILRHIYRKKYANIQANMTAKEKLADRKLDEANRKITEMENSTGKMQFSMTAKEKLADRKLDEANRKIIELENSTGKMQSSMTAKEKLANRKLDEANRKIAELENSIGKMQSSMAEREKLINMEQDESNRIIIELKNNMEKILSKLNKNEELMVLYHTILGNICNSINKLLHDTDLKRMVNNDKNNNRFKDIVIYLQAMLNKANTWDIVYNTGKSTFDEIKKMYPQLTDREFKITCLAFLGYTNTMIANVLNLKENTVLHDKSIIRSKLGIKLKGDISPIIREQLRNKN
jgi:tetratricopeptide (TPR) repeat protein/DNA-binding CsgD family transcriptional regulator